MGDSTVFTIYAIDDEHAAIEQQEIMIRKHVEGFEWLGSTLDAEEGIEDILRLNPDLVLLDIEMPEQTGLQVVEELTKRGYQGVFIFITAFTEYAIDAIRHRIFDYLLKPLSIKEFQRAMERFKQAKIQERQLTEKFRNQYSITDREAEILALLLQGYTSRDVAQKLFVSKNTVDTHRRNILRKTNTRNLLEINALL